MLSLVAFNFVYTAKNRSSDLLTHFPLKGNKKRLVTSDRREVSENCVPGVEEGDSVADQTGGA